MLRRNVFTRCSPKPSSAALGLGDAPVFRVSSFFRPVGAKEVSSGELAAEGRRTGRDAAGASVIDFVELQWMLIPYRYRKLVLEVQEVRAKGVGASLPDAQTLFQLLVFYVLVYAVFLRIGRASFGPLEQPKSS